MNCRFISAFVGVFHQQIVRKQRTKCELRNKMSSQIGVYADAKLLVKNTNKGIIFYGFKNKINVEFYLLDVID